MFLHEDSVPPVRVRPPRLVDSTSFRVMWGALAMSCGVLALIGAAVASRLS